jgi:hypothetical protein
MLDRFDLQRWHAVILNAMKNLPFVTDYITRNKKAASLRSKSRKIERPILAKNLEQKHLQPRRF